MHVVLYNSIYAQFQDALNKTNGLAVLAFLFEVCTSDIHLGGGLTPLSTIFQLYRGLTITKKGHGCKLI